MIEENNETVALDDLYLDPNNYRFIDNLDYEKVPEADYQKEQIQKRAYKFILVNGIDGIRDLVDSFKSNGFLPIEKIQVRPFVSDSSKYLVTEGNRRTVALKYLKEEYEKGNSIGNLDPEVFKRIPVVPHADVTDEKNLVMIGLNHISGKKQWPSLNQAKLMRTLELEHKMNPDDIVKKLGTTKQHFNRSQRTLYLIDQYLESDFGDQFKTDKYNYFQEIISSTDLKDWIEWDDNAYKARNIKNLERLFSYISEVEIEGDDGNYTQKREPIISKSSELRELAKIVKDEKALLSLESTGSITTAITESGVVGKTKIQSALDLIHKQINVTFNYSGYLEQKDLESIKDAVQKFNGVLIARGIDPKLKLISDIKKGEQLTNSKDIILSELNLIKYKKFINFHVKDLNRINIFAGKNNSGKTSLLEAIYQIAMLSDIDGVLEIVTRRSKVSINSVRIDWLKEQINDYQIEGKTRNSEKVSLQLRNYSNPQEVDSPTFYVNTVELSAYFHESEFVTRSHFFENKDRETEGNTKFLCPVLFSSPFSMNSSEIMKACNEVSFKRKISGKGNLSAKEVIIDFIQKFVDKDIKNIELVNDFNRFTVNHSTQENMDLSQYGEGLQRIFYISLLFAYAENGIVCIDEFENAVYFGLLKEFTKLVQELAVEFNVQVFLTTHSKECVDAFIFNNYKTEDISAYTLLPKKDGTVAAYHYPGQKLKDLIEGIDLDVREFV
ncbi:MAG: AAA family ATPase [Leptospiraceae bacterium]|nr:AAA family ATPase [Leptospiraceae bacterium]